MTLLQDLKVMRLHLIAREVEEEVWHLTLLQDLEVTSLHLIAGGKWWRRRCGI